MKKGYLLSYDKDRDSLIFDKCATSVSKLKQLLIDELYKHNEFVIEESIEIVYSNNWNKINYQFKDSDFEILENTMYFVVIEII